MAIKTKMRLASWLNDDLTSKRAEGVLFIQFMKNRTRHSGIEQSPYKAMFGIEPKVGHSTTSPIPSTVISAAQNEEGLSEMLKRQHKN